MKTNIYMQIYMQPRVMTYKSTLSSYRNIVNQIHPNANNLNKTRRRIQTRAGPGGKGRVGERDSERGGRGGRGSGSENTNVCRNDEWQVTGIDGKMIKVHLSYSFGQDQWFNIPEDIRNRLTHGRREYQAIIST